MLLLIVERHVRAKILAIIFFLTACAGADRAISNPNALRITGSHYRSMTGVAVSVGPDQMTCNRETITGSQILRWYCRSGTDSMQYLLASPTVLIIR
ncbi:MAG: hypothetical protein AUG04_10260 [Deltaproteobacteria bacterium 13_1_20CM_2_69_21]|nr:MAG: hypothetical protein AUH83_13375 [Deltaproteobacteria bacterium 13_1_40CM_4_68_19]OLD08268.1 MAG: hypothetical protein AUI90_07390 [Deltaproteobacteria bacterium 13_1_40CM_3_69_14]OLE62393.1 MAG: hypothetical protein AUG04_10260 [Deltaproteobacteria bacterium 13_1_20CM_2_69_21]